MTTNRINSRLVTLTAPNTFAAERYQGLRLKIEQMRQRTGLRVIAVTSPGAGDGKTMTSINLAGVLARDSNLRVLLIDADLRRSAVSQQLGLEAGAAGLADLIARSPKPLAATIKHPEICGFDLLPAGSSAMSVQSLFRSERFGTILEEARGLYDYVILDTPPLAPVFDAAVLARAVDGVIVVVAADKTPRRLLAVALDLLDPAKVVGIVFNNDNSPLFGYHTSAYKPYFSSGARR
ncbi:MAG TPA: CpsD/CapB family tyrosine-protein kinase [Vicinamibacterales bacterium]